MSLFEETAPAVAPFLPDHMAAPLLMKNATLPDGKVAHVLLEKGRIAHISAQISAQSSLSSGSTQQDRVQWPANVQQWDLNGMQLLPGGVDMHVHFRTPGDTHKETLLSGTMAAVKGGITTCGDMPNTRPSTTTIAALEAKMDLAKGASCRLYYHFGSTADNHDQVRLAAQHPAVKALKIYLGPSTAQKGLNGEAVGKHLRLAAELGLVVILHAEDSSLFLSQRAGNSWGHISSWGQGSNGAQSGWNASVHHLLRPLSAELASVRDILKIAKTYGTKLYLAHVTAPEVGQLVEAMDMQDQVCLEACPHHLLYAAGSEDNRYKVNPPLRPKVIQKGLFEALLNGGVNCLGSDHAPHTLQEKSVVYDEAPSGIPGVQEMFSLAIDWWQQQWLSTGRLIEVSSANAAQWFGCEGGLIANGEVADLVVVDIHKTHRLTEHLTGQASDVASRCGWSLYGNRSLQGQIKATLVAGTLAHLNVTD